MFRNVFSKSLYEKRWMMLGWSIGVIAMSLLMMGFYHSFSAGGFDQTLKNLPKSLQDVVGNLESLKTVPGYVAQQVFALRIPLLTLIMGIILFSGLLAGDEGEGTLQTLLTQPVSRLRVFAQKYAAAMLVSFVTCASAVIGVLLGLLLIHERMDFGLLWQAVIGVWLLTLLWGTLGFGLGAITGKRGLAGSITGLLAFSAYLVTSFAPSVAGLSTLDRFSPFHYYNNPAIAQYGLRATNVAVLLAVTALLLLISAIVFIKRDIYQR